MTTDVSLILGAVLKDYALSWTGDHGVGHWARVLENGLFLAGGTGADVEVVRLFAILHDARRVNEVDDPDHGRRAAEFARALRGRLFELSDDRFDRLHRACAGHTHERAHSDVTIQTCWDADRLDLGRVGITPDAGYLGAELARRPDTIRWADGRARFRIIPDFVRSDWGVDLDRGRGRGIDPRRRDGKAGPW